MGMQLSSLDIHFLLKELENLESSRVDRIYNKGKEEIYIQFHKSNVGRKILRIIIGKSIFLTETKLTDETPSGFCTFLRKHLEGKFLDSVVQLEPERILKFVFKSKDEVKKLYLELFAKGNVILCNKEDIIIDCLIKRKFRDRDIVPKEKYKHPEMQYNIFDFNKKNLTDLLKKSEKDKIVTSLAVEFGLGGVYSEEVCLLSNIDKNSDPKKINNTEITKLLNSIKKTINKKINPQIIYKDKDTIGAVPIDLELYKEHEKKKFFGFSEALDEYFTKELRFVKKEDSAYIKKINELKRIIEGQKETMASMEKKEIENREKAEIIYNNYPLIKEILDEINKASKKYSWKEIKEKLKGHKVVKDVDTKEKKIVLQI